MSAVEETQGYWSTILGNPCWIRNQPGTPKPKEECQPFTFELYPIVDVAAPTPWGLRDMERRVKLAEARQAKLRPKLESAVNGKVSRAGSKWREMPKPSADRQRRLYAEAMGRV